MTPVICAPDGSASAWPSVLPHRLGFVGIVNFCMAGRRPVSVRHECLRIRDTRVQAMHDARSDAEQLVSMWGERVSIDDLREDW
jgi:hypothetical protein